MTKLGSIILIYGLLVAFGGVFGYLHAGSQASLLAGSIFGTLLIANSFFVSDKWLFPKYLSLILSLLLELFFIYRFVVSYRFMPAGLMLILSLIMIIILVVSIVRTPRVPKDLQ